jgi:hypothetical protein
MKMWLKHGGNAVSLEEIRAHIIERHADIGQDNVQPVKQIVSKRIASNAGMMAKIIARSAYLHQVKRIGSPELAK